jgi:PAS domain-containing protein
MNALEGLMPLSAYEGRELNDIAMLQSAIEELSHDIQTDHAELMQGELPEDYVQYKELFIRRRLYLLDRLVASFRGIINNMSDPTFKADAQDNIALVNEAMEQMEPIRTAFRIR